MRRPPGATNADEHFPALNFPARQYGAAARHNHKPGTSDARDAHLPRHVAPDIITNYNHILCLSCSCLISTDTEKKEKKKLIIY